MSTALLLPRSRAQPAEPDDRGQRADRRPAVRRQALRRRALQRATASRARRAPRARSSSAPARSTRRSCWSCPASASRSGCKAVGIEVRHELQGVGENLRDHYSPRMKWSVPPALGMTYNDKMRGLGRVGAGAALRARRARGCLACRRRRSAPISAPATDWRRRTRRSPGCPFLVGDELPAGQDRPASPRSRTSCARRAPAASMSASSRPDAPPAIRFNFLTRGSSTAR